MFLDDIKHAGILLFFACTYVLVYTLGIVVLIRLWLFDYRTLGRLFIDSRLGKHIYKEPQRNNIMVQLFGLLI